ncbi:hypothetical protein ACFX11_035894 [Malus domestica]
MKSKKHGVRSLVGGLYPKKKKMMGRKQASTLLEYGGLPKGTNSQKVVREAIYVISCGYEDKTEWGKEIGWIYGSVTEDTLTGLKMHSRGWNRHCALWYAYGGKLKWMERLAYINTVYPFTSIPLVAYCTVPAVCLLTGKFIATTGYKLLITKFTTGDSGFILHRNNYATIWVMGLFLSIIATGIVELRWSNVSIKDWWRNEQFWVIGGVSAHLFAVFQGLLKVLTGVDTAFRVTSKAAKDAEFRELYLFEWTSLLIPPPTLPILNMVGVFAGVAGAIKNGYHSWGPLCGKLFFSFWVIVYLHPFLKGLMGKCCKD